MVQPFSGFGVTAQFDPESGGLHAVGVPTGPVAGVYGDLGETSVVFYRGATGLALRVGEQRFDLDTQPIAVEWTRPERRTTVFTVLAGGEIACRLTYRSLPEEMDLGRLVHDVCADPARRAGMFPR